MTDLDTIRSLRPTPSPFAEEWSATTLQRIQTRRPVRRLALLAAAAGLAGVVAGGVGLLQPDAAFAVDRQSDGDVVITIDRLADASGLERELARQGITAEVTYDAAASSASELGEGSGCLPVGAVVVDPADDGGVTITLASSYVAAHDSVLHLTAAGNHGARDWIGVRVEWAGETC